MANLPSDLVVRIREHEGAYLFPKTADALLKEAADEIERLRNETDVCRRAKALVMRDNEELQEKLRGRH